MRKKDVERMWRIPVSDRVEAWLLVKASDGLRRWHERLCGNELGVVFYDDATGKPYWQSAKVNYQHPVRDMGKFYERRVAEICKKNNLHYFIQGDPRGCALYVAGEPLTSENYVSKGVPV